MPHLARRITRTAPKSFGMYERALALQADADLIHLELGRPCHDTPEHIKAATIASLRAGNVHYSDMQGNPALREALGAKLRRENAIACGADDILITNGLTQASYAAFMALIDDGDEVIVLDPYYPQHAGKIELAGGRMVAVPLDATDGWRLRADWIEARVTARTRAIVLVNPCNPTGRVYALDELQALAEVAIRHDLAVISDEVYERITFDGRRHVSIASLPGMQARTVSLFAFTKAYAMDGWRLGYAVAEPALIAAMMKITVNEVTHVNTFIQDGALAAVSGPDDALRGFVEDDRRKRDLMVARLDRMPGIRCALPEGAIYAFPDVSGTGRSGDELAVELLERAHVVVESGRFYGANGAAHLRLCFGAQSVARIAEAMDRIEAVLAG